MSASELVQTNSLGPVDVYLTSHRVHVTRWLAGVIFVCLFPLLGFSLNQPPTWDGAMSVYPAALEIVDSGFDIVRVLGMPTYLEGGPNTYTVSPWTLTVAGLTQATGSLKTAIPILHIISFALAALTAAATYRLIAHTAPGIPAVIGALAALLFPPMLVQTADIYLDLPLACAGTWGLVFLEERAYGRAGVLTTLAVLIKPLAILFVGIIAIHVITEGSRTGRLRRLVLMTIPPLTIALALSIVQSADVIPDPLRDRLIGSISSTAQHLVSLPDVMVLFALVLAAGVALRSAVGHVETYRLAVMMVISFTGFALLGPLVTHGISIIPRYYVVVTPVLIAGLIGLLSHRSRKLSIALATLLAVLFALTRVGSITPTRIIQGFGLPSDPSRIGMS